MTFGIVNLWDYVIEKREGWRRWWLLGAGEVVGEMKIKEKKIDT
jgi:hypothetical protein